MAAKKLTYDLQDFYDFLEGNLAPKGYICVAAEDAEGNRVEIITDRNGEGEFHRVWSCGGASMCYDQIRGTNQFSLPKTELGIKRLLGRRYNDAFSC